jgi:tetratricopeptide (TPR) repeat protein
MPSGRTPRIAVLLLGAVVLLAPLYRGGVDWPVDVAAALLACLALLLGSSPEDAHGGRPLVPVSWPEATLFGAAVFVGVQLVPLPAVVIRALSPATDDLFRSSLGPLGAYPALRAMSLAPGSTARELCKAVAWTLAFAAAASFTRRTRGGHGLLAAVAAAGVAAALLALGAPLVRAGDLIGSRAVFVNPNHLAGLLGLAAWPALGFALRSRGPTRFAWFGAFGLCVLEVLLTLSRGAIAGLFVGVSVFGALMARRMSSEPRKARGSLVQPMVVGTGIIAVAAFLAFSPLAATLASVPEAPFEAKLGMWPVALRMLADYPAFGIGRGAYLTAFPAYQSEPAPFTFTHLENEWIQLPLELGLPVGLAVLGVFAWVWVTAARSRTQTLPILGALAGSAALVCHNLVDFSLELTGVAVPFAVVMGVLSGRQREIGISRWAVRIAVVLLLALGIGGMTVHRRHSLERDLTRVQRATSQNELLAEAQRALSWHPADYVTQATVGARLANEGRCADALPWLARAMLRKPTAPEPHRWAARCLPATGPESAAATEYRLAFLLGDRESLREASQRFAEPGALLRIAPMTADGLIAAGDAAPDAQDAVEAYRQCWELFEDVQALSRLTRRILDVEPQRALEFARLLQRKSPNDATGYLVAASVLVKDGQGEFASAELEAAAKHLPGDAQILIPLARILADRANFGEARAALERIAVRSSRELHDKHLYIGSMLEQAGQLADAIQQYGAAHRTLPTDPRSLDGLARIAARLGRNDEALGYLRRAASLPGVDKGLYEKRIERVQQELRATTHQGVRP